MAKQLAKFPEIYAKFVKAFKAYNRYEKIELYYTNDKISLAIRPFE